MPSSTIDIVVIGAGPAGLSAAIEAKRAGMRCIIVDRGGIVNSIVRFPGGMTFFSTPELLEIGGVPFSSPGTRPTRREGLEYYSSVAKFFELELRLYEEARSVERAGEGFRVVTSGTEFLCRSVVVATGYFDNPNFIGVPGEELPHVSHYYDEPFPYFGQRVVIVGAKNSAAIAALELYRHGAHVTLLHRGSGMSEGVKYWILPDIENRIKEGAITAHFETVVERVTPDAVFALRNGVDRLRIESRFVFILTGYHPDTSFLRRCGVNVDSATMAPSFDERNFETNIPGLYVAGSIAAGRNNNKIFIENGRLHGKVIVEDIRRKSGP